MELEEIDFRPHTQPAADEKAQAEYEAAVTRRKGWAEDAHVQRVCREVGCEPQDVTPEQRRAAKMTAWAEMYGLEPAIRPHGQAAKVRPLLYTPEVPGRILHVDFERLEMQQLVALRMLPLVHERLLDDGFVRICADSLLGTMRLPRAPFDMGALMRGAEQLEMLTPVDPPPKRDHAPQWHPTEHREHAPSGSVPRAKVLKNRAKAKAARNARKRNR